MWLLPAVLIALLNYSAFGMDVEVTINLIYEFITENKLKAAVAMTCWKRAGNCVNKGLILTNSGTTSVIYRKTRQT
jgi:hypothetical protein